MNTQKSSKKSIIIIVIIVIVAIIGYFYYSGKNQSSDTSLLASAPNAADQAVGARVLLLLNQIQSLHIDTTIFKNPAYQALQDYTVSIPTLNVGRYNPFAPLPGLPMSAPAAR